MTTSQTRQQRFDVRPRLATPRGAMRVAPHFSISPHPPPAGGDSPSVARLYLAIQHMSAGAAAPAGTSLSRVVRTDGQARDACRPTFVGRAA